MGCRKERSKSDRRVLPLLSIDNRRTSCLERKQQTCGVFGLVVCHCSHKRQKQTDTDGGNLSEHKGISGDKWERLSLEDFFFS